MPIEFLATAISDVKLVVSLRIQDSRGLFLKPSHRGELEITDIRQRYL